MKICDYCGRQNEDEAVACRECGTQQFKTPAAELNVNIDRPHRRFRFIEVLDPSELKRPQKGWPVLSGWLETAEQMSPRTPKGLLEGDYVAELPGGLIFKVVSFKSEHEAIQPALEVWSKQTKRHWAQITDGVLAISDGRRLPMETITFKRV